MGDGWLDPGGRARAWGRGPCPGSRPGPCPPAMGGGGVREEGVWAAGLAGSELDTPPPQPHTQGAMGYPRASREAKAPGLADPTTERERVRAKPGPRDNRAGT